MRYSGAGAESVSGVSFTAAPGATIGVIGGTGSGKSTLVNLIPRFYDATSGRVLVDGMDVRDIRQGRTAPPHRRRAAEGHALQGHHPRATCSGAMPTPPKRTLRDALKVAQARDMVSAKAQGLDAAGGAGRPQLLRRPAPAPDHRPRARAQAGNPDSGRQRLRAGLRDGRATCAAAIRQMDNPPTTFIVSQRAASVRYADQIIVLDDGRAGRAWARTTSCSPTCPVYQEIYDSQFKKEGS